MDFCPHLIVTLSSQYLAGLERLHMHKQNGRIPSDSDASPSSFFRNCFFIAFFFIFNLSLSRLLSLCLSAELFDVSFRFLLRINTRDTSYLDYCMSHYNTNIYIYCVLYTAESFLFAKISPPFLFKLEGLESYPALDVKRSSG